MSYNLFLFLLHVVWNEMEVISLSLGACSQSLTHSLGWWEGFADYIAHASGQQVLEFFFKNLLLLYHGGHVLKCFSWTQFYCTTYYTTGYTFVEKGAGCPNLTTHCKSKNCVAMW
jgi:hypothetical protein